MRLDPEANVRYLFRMPVKSVPSFDLAEALTRMKAGEQVAELAWKGDVRPVFIWRMHNGRGFIRLSQYYGHVACDDDLLADDWGCTNGTHGPDALLGAGPRWLLGAPSGNS